MRMGKAIERIWGPITASLDESRKDHVSTGVEREGWR